MWVQGQSRIEVPRLSAEEGSIEATPKNDSITYPFLSPELAEWG